MQHRYTFSGGFDLKHVMISCVVVSHEGAIHQTDSAHTQLAALCHRSSSY